VVEEKEVPLQELRRVMLALRIDVVDQDLKQVQALPASDPERSTRQAELIREQFTLKKEQQLLLKSPENNIM
jgi:hypothetical protein